MKLAVVGTGYVGLVSGTCFADFGHDVICIDKDANKIRRLEHNDIPIFEPGLDRLVETNQSRGRLRFSTDLSAHIANADIIFIAVGTPERHGEGYANLSYVYAAAQEIAQHLKSKSVIVTKSTVPVGTGDEIEKIIRQHNPTAEFCVASNPEFLREGAAIDDFKRPDRIIVGVEDDWAQDRLHEVYRPLNLNQIPIMFTQRRTAELIKYAANAFLAMKITFINEMADLCEKIGSNVQDVAHGIGMDKRIGAKFLHAGPGYGGSCFPKDTKALVTIAQQFDSPVTLIEQTIKINHQRKQKMAHKVINAMGGHVHGKNIAILGLSFKPNTDDIRDAPSIDIIQILQAEGAIIKAYDPQSMRPAAKIFSHIEMCENAEATIKGADAVVITTEWDEFRALDLHKMKANMVGNHLIDLRNIYRKPQVEKAGLDYTSIGRG